MTPDAAREKLAAWGRVPEAHFDAVDAALALAAADDPASPVEAAREAFEGLAAAAPRLLADNDDAATGDAAARIRLIGALLASHGFIGDRATYDAPENANLARVLVRRQGLPVALGLVWIGLSRRLGWPLAGVDFPGHFLLAMQGHANALLCDPFDGGRVLDLPALRAMKARIAGQQADIAQADLVAMTDRAVVLRLANNLRVRRLEADAIETALSITEDMRLLAPAVPSLMFAAGELALRVGRPLAAIGHLRALLATLPPPDRARAAEALLDKARQSLN
jgi:regulator of sirC expression with transglutaminase-like and TPR domain